MANDSDSRQSVALEPLIARHVELTITDDFYDPALPDCGGDRVGLGEIAFQAVPEPGTLTLLGLCLAGLATIRRTRA